MHVIFLYNMDITSIMVSLANIDITKDIKYGYKIL